MQQHVQDAIWSLSPYKYTRDLQTHRCAGRLGAKAREGIIWSRLHPLLAGVGKRSQDKSGVYWSRFHEL